MPALQSTSLTLPGTYLGILEGAAHKAGVISKLSPEKPTRFGPVSAGTFQGVPRAQIVGESEAKGGSDLTRVPVKTEPIKFQIGVRVSDEFIWGSEDYRLEEMKNVATAIGTGMGRAVDLIAMHGVNPATGLQSDKVTHYLAQTTNSATLAADGSATDAVVAAAGLVLGSGFTPTGVALDGAFSFALSTETYADGREKNPGMGFGQDLTAVKGMTAAIGSTVSGRPEIADGSGIVSFVGDYGNLRWGYQRNLPIEVIRYGDPDNTGRDLAGHNEALLRAEAVIYVLVPDLGAFAKVEQAVAP